MPTILAVITLSMTLVSAIVSISATIAIMRQKQTVLQRDLDKEGRDFKEHLDRVESSVKVEVDRIEEQLGNATRDLSQALQMIKLLSAEQALINKVTAGTLTSLIDKLDSTDESLHSAERDIAVIQEKLSKWQ